MWISETLIETNIKFFQYLPSFSGKVSHHTLHNRLQEVFLVASLIHNREVYSTSATFPCGGPVNEDPLVRHTLQEENH